MSLPQGFHYSIGGNKGGSGDFLKKMNDAGMPVMMKGASDAGLCFEAQEYGKSKGIKNLLVWRATSAREDRADYWLAPSVAAAKKWGEIKNLWPPDLDKSEVWWEIINEPRKEDAPDEVQPTWSGIHTTSWIGLFLVEMAKLMNPAGYKIAGPSFSSGEPGNAGEEVDVWMLEGMASYLRYCSDNPEKACVSVHEYDNGIAGFDACYPYHFGRFQAIIAAADRLGIPRNFKIIVTEFGWAYDNVPTWDVAKATLLKYMQLAAKFPQVDGIALWTLQDGWAGISNKLSAYISQQGNPMADWVIANSVPRATEVQPTDPAFGGTLPKEDGGGEVPEEPGDGDEPIQTIIIALTGDEVALKITALDEDDAVISQWTMFEVASIKRLVIEAQVDEGTPTDPPVDPPVDPPPDPEIPPVVQPDSPQPGDLVVDVSGHRTKVNYGALVAHNAKKVIPRTSNGLGVGYWENGVWKGSTDQNGVDVMLFAHLAGIKENFLAYDLFHFMNIKDPIGAQIDHFLNLVDQAIAFVGYYPEVLHLDFEATSPDTEETIMQSFFALRDKAAAKFGDKFQTSILQMGAYSSASWWNPKVSATNTWVKELKLKRWQAYYTSATPPAVIPDPNFILPLMDGFEGTADLWQWTSSGGTFMGQTADPYLDVNYVLPLIDQPVSTKFKVGDRVKTTGNVNVRVSPAGDSLGTQLMGSLGTVIGGPVYASAYHRWQINYDTGADGWTAENWLEKVPTITVPTLLGLHASADGGTGASLNSDIAEFAALKPGVVKFMTSHGPEMINPIMNAVGSNVTVIVRPYLSWGGRPVTADEFVQWTEGDYKRTIDTLVARGVGLSQIWVECHNEPNMAIEGFTFSWGSGTSFATWALAVQNKMKPFYPAIKWLFPGLSPGVAIPGLRVPAATFFTEAKAFADACDGIGVHAYWAANDPRSNALAWVDQMGSLAPGKPMWVTECSYKSPAGGDLLATEYNQFMIGLDQRPSVYGATFYVVSALDKAYDNEVWVRNGVSRGIAQALANLRK